MKDPAGAILLIALVLIPPAAVLTVIRVEMRHLREMFFSEIAKLRSELSPQFQPEQILLPHVEALTKQINGVSERVTHMERLLEALPKSDAE